MVGDVQPTVRWSDVRNPILSSPHAGVKDQAMVWFEGRWHMLFSYVTGDRRASGGVHWSIASSTSPDLAHWSAPVPWPAQTGTLGVASPDLVEAPDGRFVATYESDPGDAGGQDHLYYRTSADLVHWSAPRPLARTLGPAPQDRMIDPALAWTGHGLILAYKSGTAAGGQHFEVAWSPSGSLGGPWQALGRPAISAYGDTFENFELVVLAGRWRLVATSNTGDQPWMFTLGGDPSVPQDWLDWTDGHELQVPQQRWDSGPGISSIGYERANSAFVCAGPGGWAYLTYAGSNELTTFGGWGHAKIGVARSRDLVTWQTPPPAAGPPGP